MTHGDTFEKGDRVHTPSGHNGTVVRTSTYPKSKTGDDTYQLVTIECDNGHRESGRHAVELWHLNDYQERYGDNDERS